MRTKKQSITIAWSFSQVEVHRAGASSTTSSNAAHSLPPALYIESAPPTRSQQPMRSRAYPRGRCATRRYHGACSLPTHYEHQPLSSRNALFGHIGVTGSDILSLQVVPVLGERQVDVESIVGTLHPVTTLRTDPYHEMDVQRWKSLEELKELQMGGGRGHPFRML